MANEWLRLWHDMPNDPKFKTVARISGQPISLVLSMYLHLLVDASRNVTRGHVDVTFEDLASALDVNEDQISSIYDAMQGRLIDENRLTGWETRQPKKEDHGNISPMAMTPAERKRAQREREKSRIVTDCHDESRDVTLDKDKDKDIKAIVVSLADHASDCPHQEIIKLYHEILPVLPPVKIWNKARMAKLRQLWKEDKKRQSLDYWFRFFTYVSESDFLMGRTEKPFHGVNLEWLITQKNFTKIIERNYENRGAA